MPLKLAADHPTLIIRREAYERANLVRASLDERLGLTPDEFRVEGDLVVIGPVLDAEELGILVNDLEGLGLVYFDDFFEMTGNWPGWLEVFVRG